MAVAGIVFQLVFGSLFALALNMVFSAGMIYLAAQWLELKDNSFEKAGLVVFAGFAVVLLQSIFFEPDFLFSWVLGATAYIYSIKSVYSANWSNSFLIAILSILMAFFFAVLLVPTVESFLFSF
jgi:hypothetical protein